MYYNIVIEKVDEIIVTTRVEKIKEFMLEAQGIRGGKCHMHTGRILDDSPEIIQTVENAENAKETDCTESNPFKFTVPSMLSDDYKERFKAEYFQTKIRWERLKAFNTKILASKINVETEAPKHDCPDGLLFDQEKTMRKYLDILETRAAIEKIDLL